MKMSKALTGSIIASSLLLNVIGTPIAFAGEKPTDKTAVSSNSKHQQETDYQVIDATPVPGTETHYEYNVPNFSLAKGESAFTTRSGYGFVICDDLGPDYNDIDVTFNVTGTSVLMDLAVVKYSDFSTNPTDVKNNPSKYAVGGVQRVTAAGSGKAVSFNNLPYNTYVVLWKNVGSNSLSVNTGHIATSW